jgi:hypothetical protein
MNTMRAVVATSAVAVALLLAGGPAAMAQGAPPTAPGNLRAVSVSDVDIVLAWDESTDDDGAVNYAVFLTTTRRRS